MGSVVNKKATSSSIYGKYLIFQDSITPTVYKLFHKIEKRTLFSKEHYEVRVTSILNLTVTVKEKEIIDQFHLEK